MTKTEVYLKEKITHSYVTEKIYLYIYIQRLVLNPHFLKFCLKLSVCTLSSMFFYILHSCLLGLKLLTCWRRQWQPTPVLLPGKSHGQRNLVGCSPWGLEESDMTERLHFHFSLS